MNYRACAICSLIHMDPPPCSHSIGKRTKEWETERERCRDPVLGLWGLVLCLAPSESFPFAFWVNNPKKSTQTTTSPTVNENSACGSKPISHKTEISPHVGFSVGIILGVWLTGYLCFTSLFGQLGCFELHLPWAINPPVNFCFSFSLSLSII